MSGNILVLVMLLWSSGMIPGAIGNSSVLWKLGIVFVLVKPALSWGKQERNKMDGIGMQG